MNEEALREETRKRLAEVDRELANDDVEVERQMPDVLDRLIAEADMSHHHHQRIAVEGLTPRYKEAYQRVADQQRDRASDLRRFQTERNARTS